MSFVPEKRRFYEGSLSVITTILPSEKISRPAGTPLKKKEMPGFIASNRDPVQN
jgi:hypothetical protein